ncbi:MAG: hypothetical protein C4B57_00740 [Deltaproteobacteria bacterium]|nr:MAG: hypothetical protein C4B57_00740 [Deltaproteobacteria bacterium]
MSKILPVRVVLDTNILISSIFFSGPPAQILSHWRKRSFAAVISEPIILEYIRVVEEISQKFPLQPSGLYKNNLRLRGLYSDPGYPTLQSRLL